MFFSWFFIVCFVVFDGAWWFENCGGFLQTMLYDVVVWWFMTCSICSMMYDDDGDDDDDDDGWVPSPLLPRKLDSTTSKSNISGFLFPTTLNWESPGALIVAGQGLPSDRVSCENGAILCNSQRWSLLGEVSGQVSIFFQRCRKKSMVKLLVASSIRFFSWEFMVHECPWIIDFTHYMLHPWAELRPWIVGMISCVPGIVSDLEWSKMWSRMALNFREFILIRELQNQEW